MCLCWRSVKNCLPYQQRGKGESKQGERGDASLPGAHVFIQGQPWDFASFSLITLACSGFPPTNRVTPETDIWFMQTSAFAWNCTQQLSHDAFVHRSEGTRDPRISKKPQCSLSPRSLHAVTLFPFRAFNLHFPSSSLFPLLPPHISSTTNPPSIFSVFLLLFGEFSYEPGATGWVEFIFQGPPPSPPLFPRDAQSKHKHTGEKRMRTKFEALQNPDLKKKLQPSFPPRGTMHGPTQNVTMVQLYLTVSPIVLQ